MRTPEELVITQLDYYNKHDLEGFLSVFHDDTKIYNLIDGSLIMEGKEAMRQRYGERFSHPDLHAEIVNRIIIGNKVIDHESVTGAGNEKPVQVAAIYEIQGDFITTVWFVRE